MAVTGADEQTAFLAASAALLKIRGSPDASPAEVAAAREEHARLTTDFQRKALGDVDARTARFERMVAGMESVLAKIRNPELPGVSVLRAALGTARKVLGKDDEEE